MSGIKKHQCPSCGGDLSIDNDKQMYRCISCGSAFDYDYFREEQLHGMGETYLSRGECKAAVDAYKLVLKKNPHDFQALRGLMLASAYLKDMDDLVRIVDSKYFSFDPKLAGEVMDSASYEDREYFAEFSRIYDSKKKLIGLNREIESLRQEHKRIEASIRLTDDSRYEYYFTRRGGSRQSPKEIFIIVWCLTAFYVVSGIAGVFTAEGAEGFFAVTGIIALLVGGGFNFLKVFPRMKMIKEIDADIQELLAESETTGKQIKNLEAEAEKLTGNIRSDIGDLVKKDHLIMTGSSKEQVSEISKIKQHQCPSCGGSLRIDRDKQIYHCAFCGSTYDYEYFGEDHIHEAGETYLSRGEFMATADAYEFMLKKDPHDFLALRGLMLAAAHLTDMSELEHENKEVKFSYDPQMVSEAIESALDEDKEYFTELGKVYADRKRLAEFTEEIETLWEEKSKINSNIAHNNIKRGDYYLEGRQTPYLTFIVAGIVNAFLIILTILSAVELFRKYGSDIDSANTLLKTVIVFCVLSIGLAVYNFGVNYSKVRKLKKTEKANAELYVESGRMDEKIRALENESAELTNEIRRTIHDFVKKDRLEMKRRRV